MSYEGENRREPERWRLSREVSVTDLVTVVLAFTAVLAAYSNLDKRVDGLERMVAVQTTNDKRQDDESLRYQARSEAQFLIINQKLDRLIEGRR